MFSISVKAIASYGTSIENSNLVKRGNIIKEVYRTNSDLIVLEHYVKKMVDYAQSTAPKRTGRLRRSIKMEKTENGFRFFSDSKIADYGIYVEKGTRRHPAPQAFFVPAIMRNRDSMRKAWINYFRGKAVSGYS